MKKRLVVFFLSMGLVLSLVQVSVSAAAPALISVTPSNGAANVAEDTDMTLNFDTVMDITTFTAANILLDGAANSGTIKSIAGSDAFGKSVTIDFKGLTPGAHTVTLNNLKDLTAQTLASTNITFMVVGTANYLVDGGFEYGYLPPVWSSTGTAGIETGIVHFGKKSVKITDKAGGGGLAGWNIVTGPFQASKTYYAGLYIYVPAGSVVNRNFLIYAYYYSGGTLKSQQVWAGQTVTATDTWTKQTYSFTINDTVDASPMPYLAGYYNDLSTVGTIYVDDMYVREALPSVLLESATPGNGSTNVQTKEDIVCKFNSDMDFSTLTAGNIKINGATTLINTITTDPNDLRRCRIKVNALECNTPYTVTLNNNVKNVFGVAVPSTQTFSFTTGPAFSYTNNFYKAYNTPSQSLVTGHLEAGNISGVETVVNNGSTPKEMVMIYALYDGINLVDVKTKNFTAEAYSSVTVNDSISVPDLTSGDYRLAVCVWDGLSTMVPLTNIQGINE